MIVENIESNVGGEVKVIIKHNAFSDFAAYPGSKNTGIPECKASPYLLLVNHPGCNLKLA